MEEEQVQYELIHKGFPELTVTYVKSKNTTYILAWKRYVFGTFDGDQRASLKAEIKKQIHSWVLKLAMFVTYHEIENATQKKEVEDGK